MAPRQLALETSLILSCLALLPTRASSSTLFVAEFGANSHNNRFEIFLRRRRQVTGLSFRSSNFLCSEFARWFLSRTLAEVGTPEFEKEYDSGEVRGSITRDVVADVMNEILELLNASNEEKFVDVDAVLNEAMRLANKDFVFDDEFEGTMV